MKKQLLILIVALFAIGLSSAQAQIGCPIPRAVQCLTGDALHPIAGTPYTYEVTVPTPPGTKMYQWYATQDQAFIAAGVLNSGTALLPGGPILASASAWYNVSTQDANNIILTWQSFNYDPLQPVFVVINVINTGTCTTENLKVYKIEPQNAFTLDIANVSQTGTVLAYGVDSPFCIHDIVTATYNATAPEGVIYDFGVDYMYFTVTAANFSESWRPSLTLTGMLANESVTAVEWSYNDALPPAFTADGTFTLAAGIWTTATDVMVQDPSGFVGAAGECIIIRVTLDHSVGALTYQGLLDEPITLAVDGVTNLVGPTVPDVHYLAGAGCGQPDGYTNDLVVQTLLARPTINAGATMPAPGLLPVQP